MARNDTVFATKSIHKWSDIRQYLGHGYLYRGQQDSQWGLMTSLERSFRSHQVRPPDMHQMEDMLFREFRRAYHQDSAHIPNRDCAIEWLALMQHFGAPTRLLDFSYSLYIAAYFAVEKRSGDCAIWSR